MLYLFNKLKIIKMKSSYEAIKFSKQKRFRKGKFITCEKCQISFYVMPSRLKHGNPRFCSTKCYDKAGNNNPNWKKPWRESQRKAFYENPNRPKFKTGLDNPNHTRFVDNLNFWGSTIAWYRTNLVKRIGKCEICAFDDKRILQVHHKDKNRKNNTRENVILVCPNCHALEHWKGKSGMYKWIGKGEQIKKTMQKRKRNTSGKLI